MHRITTKEDPFELIFSPGPVCKHETVKLVNGGTHHGNTYYDQEKGLELVFLEHRFKCYSIISTRINIKFDIFVWNLLKGLCKNE